jgi:hypothetical protein
VIGPSRTTAIESKWVMVRPSGFEPPTFCSGGIAASGNLLILRWCRIALRSSWDPLSEKLLGKLLGRFLACSAGHEWLVGTYHGVSRDQLYVYLDEFTFRHKRRRAANGRLPDPARFRNRT